MKFGERNSTPVPRVLNLRASGFMLLMLGANCFAASAAADQRALARALKEECLKEISETFSTKPVRIHMGEREYVIPVNYFTPHGRGNPDVASVPADRGFGFRMFLPAFSGYSQKHCEKTFDPNEIEVTQAKPVDKGMAIPNTAGAFEIISPAGYGDPRARFENIRSMLEPIAVDKKLGLDGYRFKPGGSVWVGTQSTGEFFFFTCSLLPGERPQPGVTNPQCQAKYYSHKEDFYVVYTYSQLHMAKWREIDAALWAKLREWRVK